MKADRDDSTLVAGKLPTRLTAVPLTQVTIEDDFWSPRLQLWQSVTLNDALDKFERNGRSSEPGPYSPGVEGWTHRHADVLRWAALRDDAGGVGFPGGSL